MKIDSVKIQNNKPSFKGSLADGAVNFISKHPMVIAGLAGSSVIAQKMVMTTSESTIGPVMDIGIGKVLTKVTDEKEGRINQSSKAQAIRTASQSIGGTITGITIRGISIALATLGLMKAGEKAGGVIAEIINKNGDKTYSKAQNLYEYTENAKNWGKTLGGAIAIAIMMVTNFLLDAPLINWINKKMTNFVNKGKKENKGEING